MSAGKLAYYNWMFNWSISDVFMSKILYMLEKPNKSLTLFTGSIQKLNDECFCRNCASFLKYFLGRFLSFIVKFMSGCFLAVWLSFLCFVSRHYFFLFIFWPCICLVFAAGWILLVKNSECSQFSVLTFVIEAALKLIALGPAQYFGDEWNTFDFIVTALGDIEFWVWKIFKVYLWCMRSDW